MSPITSRHNAVVARYRAAAQGEAGAVVLLDGAHLVNEALSAGIGIHHAAVTPAARERGEIGALVATLERSGTEIASVSQNVMEAMSPVRSSSGLIALADRPAHSLEDVFTGAAPLVIAAVDVQDPGNIGAIARVAEAGGATGMVAAGASADPFSWKALRGSMGSSLRLPIAIAPAEATIAEARRRHCVIVAAVPRDGRSPHEIDFRRPAAIVIGGEGPGLAESLAAGADELVSIPMQAPVESLNTAVAAALLVYEAQRQRTRN